MAKKVVEKKVEEDVKKTTVICGNSAKEHLLKQYPNAEVRKVKQGEFEGYEVTY